MDKDEMAADVQQFCDRERAASQVTFTNGTTFTATDFYFAHRRLPVGDDEGRWRFVLVGFSGLEPIQDVTHDGHFGPALMNALQNYARVNGGAPRRIALMSDTVVVRLAATPGATLH
jgi:hypothetical protein